MKKKPLIKKKKVYQRVRLSALRTRLVFVFTMIFATAFFLVGIMLNLNFYSFAVFFTDNLIVFFHGGSFHKNNLRVYF